MIRPGPALELQSFLAYKLDIKGGSKFSPAFLYWIPQSRTSRAESKWFPAFFHGLRKRKFVNPGHPDGLVGLTARLRNGKEDCQAPRVHKSFRVSLPGARGQGPKKSILGPMEKASA